MATSRSSWGSLSECTPSPTRFVVGAATGFDSNAETFGFALDPSRFTAVGRGYEESLGKKEDARLAPSQVGVFRFCAGATC
jgi:hypothetical protein